MQISFARATVALLILSLCSCTRISVTKNPTEKTRGIRYYRPKPYLFVAPAGGGGSAKTPTCGDANVTVNCDRQKSSEQPESGKTRSSRIAYYGNGNNEPNATPVSVSISLQYLPDFSEEYAIDLKPGMGVGELSLELENGWNLTSINMKTDQQVDETISALAQLIGSVPVKVLDENEGTKTVPIGFYEAVIATDGCGKKRLYGWRYVGFAPAAGCQVCPDSQYQHLDCRKDLWELVPNEEGALIFQRIAKKR